MDQCAYASHHQKHQSTQSIEFDSQGCLKVSDRNPCQVGFSSLSCHQEEQHATQKGSSDGCDGYFCADSILLEGAKGNDRSGGQR